MLKNIWCVTRVRDIFAIELIYFPFSFFLFSFFLFSFFSFFAISEQTQAGSVRQNESAELPTMIAPKC